MLTNKIRITEFAAKNKLPAMYPSPEYTDVGGLVSYSPIYTELFRRAATYVHKILKGAKPADLPVEQPTKFEFVINLQDSETNRSHDSTKCAGESGQSDQVRTGKTVGKRQ